MSIPARETLVDLLLSTYPDLKRRLTGRLGSADLASEALQDTYVRLRRAEHIGEVRNPKAYLFRMALNIASNRRRDDAPLLSAAEVEVLIEVPDDAPNPLQVVEARSTLAAVERALAEMPERRRRIFYRVWLDRAPHKLVASEFGIAIRTVRQELHLATKHLHDATQEISVAGLQHRLAQVSSK